MADLTIQSVSFDWSDTLYVAGLELYVFSSMPWVDIDGEEHGAGNQNDTIFTQRVPGLTNNATTHRLTIPTFTLPPTRNALRGNNVRLSFWVMRVAGRNVTPIKQVPGTEGGLAIPPTLASLTTGDPLGLIVTFADLITYNAQPASLPADDWRDYLNRLIAANIGAGGIGGSGIANRVPVFNSIVNLSASPITADELGHLTGVSADIQPQLDARVIGTGEVNQVPFFSDENEIAGDTEFTWNNTTKRLIAPHYDKGGVRYVVEAYRVPAGDQASLEAAIAALGIEGGIVEIAPGRLVLTDDIQIGDGTGNYSSGAATYSNKHGVILQGTGGGAGPDGVSSGYSTIVYNGSPIAGAALNVNGPMFKVGLRNLTIDCNGLAAIGYDLNHVQESLFENVKVLNNTGFGMRLRGYANPTGGGNGANNNTFRQCFVNSTQSGAGGLDLGAQSTQASPFLGVSQNVFDNCRWRFDGAPGTTTGVRLNFCDANTFINCLTFATNSVDVRPPSGTAGANYPQAITLLNCPLQGNLVQSGAVVWSGTNGLTFLGYPIDDGETIPPATPVNLYKGIDTHGNQFGKFKNQPLLFSLVTPSSAIANTLAETAFDKSKTLEANILSLTGASLRIRARGHYSTTGTPNLTLKFKIGSTVIAEAVLICAAGASNLGWSAEAEAVMLFSGVVLQRGFSLFALANGGISTSALAFNVFPFDPIVTQAVTITATWDVASASNSITLETLTIEPVYPRDTL